MSAEEGHADAQYNLGFMYAAGVGVKKDVAQAIIWYRKAAQQRLIDRFVVLHPDRLVKLTALRARVKTRRNDSGRSP